MHELLCRRDQDLLTPIGVVILEGNLDICGIVLRSAKENLIDRQVWQSEISLVRVVRKYCMLSMLISDSRLIWFGSVYLVTTAGFVADQLM